MRIAASLAIAAVLFSVGAAYAAEPTPPQGQDPDEIICRTVALPTGTRLGRSKECHSWREWEMRRQEDREMTERTQMRDSRNPAIPGGN